jgi:hypothetical protein
MNKDKMKMNLKSGNPSMKLVDSEPRGLVFSIQAHSVHDGPGARTPCS